MQKNLQLAHTIRDLRMNEIYEVSETWLMRYDDEKRGYVQNEPCFLLCDWIAKHHKKSRGDVLMLVTSKNRNPGLKDGLKHINEEIIESVWFPCKIFNNNFRIAQLVDVSYNPKKPLSNCFLTTCRQILI